MVQATVIASPADARIVRPSGRSAELLVLVALVALFAGLLALWHWFDHTTPAPDDSSYILNSFQYADLLRHPKFWKLDWWHSMLTVSQLYPPMVFVTNGALRMMFGPSYWVDVLSAILFNCVLTATIYGTTRIIGGDRISAVLAAVIVNLYPEISAMTHCFLLDGPLISMVSCGLFALVWWRSSPRWTRALVCGVLLGFACLTKQIATAYLFWPGLFFMVESIVYDVRSHVWRRTPQLLTAAGVTLTLGLPWLLTNLSYIRSFAHYNQSAMGPLTLWQVFPDHLAFYARSLPSIMSPLLFAAFVFALFCLDRRAHRLLLPTALAGLGGVVSVCTLTWGFPSLRYDAPALVVTAIYTGWAMSAVLARRFGAIAVWGILILAVAQFIAFNFAPYPITEPKFIKGVSERLGVNLVEVMDERRQSQILHSNPLPPQDWGQQWVISTIDRVESKKAVWLNIIPDYSQLNGNTFELIARRMGSPVRPTTSRRWTVMGDVVAFDPQVAMYYQWYLLKSGYQGNILRDDDSKKNYNRLIDFVKQSGKFNLIGSRELPDRTTIFLYRQK